MRIALFLSSLSFFFSLDNKLRRVATALVRARQICMCVRGARASHLLGVRCYIPSGTPERQACVHVCLKRCLRTEATTQLALKSFLFFIVLTIVFASFSLFFPQNAEQQQHQRHPGFQLQPHAQAPHLVSLTHTHTYKHLLFTFSFWESKLSRWKALEVFS